PLGRLDGRHAHLDVLIVLAVILTSSDLDDLGALRVVSQHWEFLRNADRAFGQITDGDAVVGVADVKNALAGTIVLVLENREQRIHGVVNVRERALLLSAIDELDRPFVEYIREELREYARAALLRLLDVVEVRTDEVEGPEQRVVEVVPHTVG